MQKNKKLAKKYQNRPEYLTHAFYTPERLISEWKSQGNSDDEIKQKLIEYIKMERQKCVDDVVYFATTYGFISGPGGAGIIPFSIEDYQRDLLSSFQKDKYIIGVKARQLGVSTSLVFYALWFSIFSTGKRCLVVAHRRESAEEFVTKLKTAYEFLPEWLKPACTLYSKNTVEFETKSVVKAITSNPHAARSFSATVFLVDEAAFIKDADEVIKGLLPTISASDGKLIAISTPNGNSDSNWFYRTFTMAKSGLNGWKWFELEWGVSSIFRRNPNFRQDQIRIDNGNEDKFKQEYECFEGTACVSTPYGLSQIQELKTGDHVISHSGRIRKILATMNKEYSGDFIQIHSSGTHEPLRCTPEHPIQIYKRETQEYFWKLAKDITPQDWVVFPKLNTNIVASILSEDLVRILAWYITEGSCGYGYVKFSLSHDLTEVSHVSSILTRLNIKHSKRHGPTGWQLQINNANFSDFLKSSCGSGAEYKRIPFSLIGGRETLFFDELILGDGCYTNGVYQYATISKQLAYQVQLLAHSLPDRRYLAAIRMAPAHQSIIEGRVVNCSDSYHVKITLAEKRNREIKLHRAKCSIAMKVSSVEVLPFSGTVYNLQVQYDESYIVAGRSVHNCCFDVNLNSLFTRAALDAFKPSTEILNRVFGGSTYEDCFLIWKLAVPNVNYTIGVDCASNKITSKDSSSFQVIDTEDYTQMAEYLGKLPTEVFVDILIKAARHYNNALLVIEANSYSEMVFYLLEQKGYTNIWYDGNKTTPGFQTNRATRNLLIDKLILFYNNPLNSSKLNSARLKMQMENFSAGAVYADGARKYEAVKGHDDAVLALALGVVTMTPKEHIHRPLTDYNIAVDTKEMSSGNYSEEYIQYHSQRMGIAEAVLENRLRLYHSIKEGIYDGSGLEDLNVMHPVEEFEKQLAVSDFIGTTQMIATTDYSTFENVSLIPKDRRFSLEDIFDDGYIAMQKAHYDFWMNRYR